MIIYIYIKILIMEGTSIEKKTLINSHERLLKTIGNFQSLAATTKIMVEKFERIEELIQKNEEVDCEKESILNIVDIFNRDNERLNNLFNVITNDVERVLSMIE
jgi:hypothetical protein